MRLGDSLTVLEHISSKRKNILKVIDKNKNKVVMDNFKTATVDSYGITMAKVKLRI